VSEDNRTFRLGEAAARPAGLPANDAQPREPRPFVASGSWTGNALIERTFSDDFKHLAWEVPWWTRRLQRGDAGVVAIRSRHPRAQGCRAAGEGRATPT